MTTLELMPEHPLHTALWARENYEGLDEGIRFPVKVLHAAGIPTCQSCEGGEGHAYDLPSIDMIDARAFEAMERLESYGITVRAVSSVWRVQRGVPVERVWRVELREPQTSRADDWPQFIYAHLHRDCWAPEHPETEGREKR